jgi:gamma-glutamyltranspeptidase
MPARAFPVSTRLSLDIGGEVKKVSADSALARTFLVNGAAPSPGSLLVQKELAATLRLIATGGARAYYIRRPGAEDRGLHGTRRRAGHRR